MDRVSRECVSGFQRDKCREGNSLGMSLYRRIFPSDNSTLSPRINIYYAPKKKLTGSLEASKDSAGAGDPSACQSVDSVVESHNHNHGYHKFKCIPHIGGSLLKQGMEVSR